MGSVYDRMKVAGPLWREMMDRFNAIVNGYNGMRGFIRGLNPHLSNDGQNTAATAADLDGAMAMTQEAITDYRAHISRTAFIDAMYPEIQPI